MILRHAIFPLLAMCLLGGCQEKVESLVDDYIAEGNKQADIYCDCFMEYGFGTRTECEDAFGYIGPSRERCIIDAFLQDEDAARDYLECVNALNAEFTSCLNTRLDCNDATSDQACVDDFNVGFDGCIQLPQNVTRDLEECV